MLENFALLVLAAILIGCEAARPPGSVTVKLGETVAHDGGTATGRPCNDSPLDCSSDPTCRKAAGETPRERACSLIPTFGYGEPDNTLDCASQICACWGTARFTDRFIEASDRAGPPPFPELASAVAARRQALVEVSAAMKDMVDATERRDTPRLDAARARYLKAVRAHWATVERIKIFCTS